MTIQSMRGLSDIVGIEVFHRPRFVPRCQSQTFCQRVQSTDQHRQRPRRARHIPARHPGDHLDGFRPGGREGEGGTPPQAPGEVTGAFFSVACCRTAKAVRISSMATVAAQPSGSIQGCEVGSPLGGVALAGEVLERADLTAKGQPPEFALGRRVNRTISKALAVWLRGRDRRGGNRWFMAARPQISVAIAQAGLARPALAAPFARHCLPSWRRSERRPFANLQ